jgi:type IV secretion system protein VirD4
VIPNLLDHPGSVVVTDIKGENYRVAMARRCLDLGHEVHALDPFDTVGGSSSFNPIDLVDPYGPDAADDAVMIADMLVVTGARGGDHQFWDEEARALLTGLVLHVAQLPDPNERTLPHLRSLLTGTPSELEQLWDEMTAAGGLVRRAAARVLQKADRERSGVISSAQSHTHFLDSPRMERVLGSSSLDLDALKRGRTSVFLIIPPDRLEAYQRWLRLMIAVSLRALTRTPGQPAQRVLFVLDEFANLGPMQPVVRAVSLMGGYGASFWILLQDLAQLRGTYPEKWGTFLANADVLQAFGTADQFTAEYLSKMTGVSTIRVESSNSSEGRSHQDLHIMGGTHHGTGSSVSETGRPLLLPDEVRRLGPEKQLLFVKGSNPVLADRVNYLRDPEFTGLYSENPMYHQVG